MNPPILIRFNAAQSKLIVPEQFSALKWSYVYESLTSEFSYQDKSKQFLKYNRPGLRNLDTRVCLFDAKRCVLPTGLLYRLIQVLKAEGVSYELEMKISDYIPPFTPDALPDWLKPYQKLGIERAILAKRCGIQSPTGSGKTVIASFYAKSFPKGSRILVTVPTVKLLGQTAEVLAGHLGCEVGMWGGGKKDWKPVTVGVANSLSKLAQEKDSRLRSVQVLIFDEYHTTANSYCQNIGRACINTSYRLGLSATAFREQGDDLLMEAVTGPLVLSIKPQEVQAAKTNIKPSVFVLDIPASKEPYPGSIKNKLKAGTYLYPTDNGKPALNDVYARSIVHNNYRNGLCIEILEAFARCPTRTGPALILVERVEHGQLLEQLAERRGIRLPFLRGGATKKVSGRSWSDEVIAQLRDNEIIGVVATKVLNMGVDIQNLELVVIASGGRSKTRVLQQIGRVVRYDQASHKHRAMVVDFRDLDPYYLRQQSDRRVQSIREVYPGSVRYVSLKELKEQF
jgi:superfamily II DNA or RNA helicase